MVGNPPLAKRTWNVVISEILKHKTGQTRRRWTTAAEDKALIPLNGITLLDTTADHFLRALGGETSMPDGSRNNLKPVTYCFAFCRVSLKSHDTHI